MKFTVRQARRHAELTQETVAKELGVNVGTYAKLEKRPERFTMEQALRFCKAVSLPADEINFFASEST